MRPREVVVRAERIDSRGRRTKTYDRGRTCSYCDTILSVFNRTQTCSLHESPVWRKYRARPKAAS